jgi:hypothetical protein
MGVSAASTRPLPNEYFINDVINANPLYIGKVQENGIWLIVKYDQTGGSMTYANQSNQIAVYDYSGAWTNRAGLTYGQFQTLQNV